MGKRQAVREGRQHLAWQWQGCKCVVLASSQSCRDSPLTDRQGDGTAKRKREIQAKKVWLAKIEQDEFVTALRGMERSEQTGRLLDIIRDDIHMTKKEIKLLRKAG